MAAACFRDRAEGGRALAGLLREYGGRDDVIVLALPRGGVPVGAAVADALEAPLDVLVVRKLGVPRHEELAMGAIASGGVLVLDEGLVRTLGIDEEQVRETIVAQSRELERRERAYREGREPQRLEGRTAIVVDDGLATGATMRAAVRGAREHRPARIVVGVPVAAAETCAELRAHADEVVSVATPSPFGAVGLWYDDFAQTSDAEVRELLARAAKAESAR
jgi:predicted phosphoribosyltransferase